MGTKLWKGFCVFMAEVCAFLLHVAEKDVTVGLCVNMDPRKAHGVASFVSNHGQECVPFVVDRPDNLVKPTKAVVKSIFAQLARLGYPVTEIEIKVGKEVRVYNHARTAPLVVQAI